MRRSFMAALVALAPVAAMAAQATPDWPCTVSYTHLTLPTICSV